MISLNFRTFVFEVWVEGRKLLSMLDMCEAIASFLHLSFVFNLEYPGVIQVSKDTLRILNYCQIVADIILQRCVAEYGDYSGINKEKTLVYHIIFLL